MTFEASAMHRAIELARKGEGFVEPNPMVGALVFSAQEELVGKGYHERFGGPHAEIVALREAGEKASSGTLVVSLEPCCHQGKTGPCTEAILAAGIQRVVVGTLDPNPLVRGKGIARLREAGIVVLVGIEEVSAKRLIAPFRSLIQNRRPYVHAKWAMTLDGKIAARTGESKWISGEESRQVVHKLRGRMDAILVGAGTLLRDDPLLTPRPPGPRIPLRIVLDRRGRAPLQSKIFQSLSEGPVLVITESDEARDRLATMGVETRKISNTESSLSDLLMFLGERSITNLLVEGGAEIHGAFFDADLVDEVHVFIAPTILGGQSAIGPVAGLGVDSPARGKRILCEERLMTGEDYYFRGIVVSSPLTGVVVSSPLTGNC